MCSPRLIISICNFCHSLAVIKIIRFNFFEHTLCTGKAQACIFCEIFNLLFSFFCHLLNSFGASVSLNLYALSIPYFAAVVNPFSCTFVRCPYTFARSLSLLFIFFLRPRAFYYGKRKQPTKGEKRGKEWGKANPLPPPERLLKLR